MGTDFKKVLEDMSRAEDKMRSDSAFACTLWIGRFATSLLLVAALPIFLAFGLFIGACAGLQWFCRMFYDVCTANL